MDYAAHVDAVEREAAALVAALRAGTLDAAVPSCPGWTLRDLVVHVGQFSGFWTHVLCEGTGRPKPEIADAASAPDLPSWYEALSAHLVDELRRTPAQTEVWTWVPDDQSARFVARRSANELAVHRVDAELARGEAAPIDAALAADGIDETFVMIEHRRGRDEAATGGAGQTLHLHGTDHGDEWLIKILPDRLEVTHEHGKGDLALRGAVSDLELVLYGRPTSGSVDRFGDAAVLETWREAFTF